MAWGSKLPFQQSQTLVATSPIHGHSLSHPFLGRGHWRELWDKDKGCQVLGKPFHISKKANSESPVHIGLALGKGIKLGVGFCVV